jgi:hypothetical protein
LPTVWTGIALLAAGTTIFGVQELALDRSSSADFEDLLHGVFLTLTHIVIVVYLLTAFVYYQQVRDQTIGKVRGLLGDSAEATGEAPRTTDRVVMWLAGLVGVAAAVLASPLLTPGSPSYHPGTWSPETAWHRVLSPVIGFLTARLSLLIVLGSGRVSDLATTIPEIDLLQPERLAPFVRLGLTGALLVIGSVSVFALFLVDVGYLALVASLLVLALGVGGLALFLPLRGVRERIRIAKREELGWVREKMRSARDELAAGRSSAGQLEELIAWETRVDSVAEWPVDATTFIRFALYLLIPLGSWAGGAMVERLIDTVLD